MSKRIRATARKAQIIADAMMGKDDERILPAMLGDPWGEYLTWVREWIAEDPTNVDTNDIQLDFYQWFVARATEDREVHLQNYDLIGTLIQCPVVYESAAKVVNNLPDLEWLWPNWLPLGLVSLLAAVPGTGKSYLALDLAHRVIRGGQFPDGAAVTDRGPVVYVDAEDTPSIFKERVQVWGEGDLDRLYLMQPDPERMTMNLDDYEDRERLWDMAWKVRPRLLIVDSYGAATLRGENNKEDVQQMLSYFNMLAREFNLALLVVHHLRKRSGPQTSFMPMTIDSIRGSSHIPAIARMVIGLQWVPTAEHQDENGPRQMWVMKTNVTRYPEPLGVYFEPHPECSDVALLRYGEAPRPYREATKGDECAEWLEDLLRSAEEPMSPKDVIEYGKEVGFNQRMIYRIRHKLSDRISDTMDNKRHPDNKWVWEASTVEED